MNIFLLTPLICGKPSLLPTPYSRFKQSLAICSGVFLLMFAGITQADLPFEAGLALENEMDSNGNITVINGSKVKVAYEVDDPAKLSNKADRIQLLRVLDDSVVSSVARGKKKSGTVSLVVKKSEDEALYIRYIRKGKVIEVVSAISHPDDPDHIPLLSIPKASLSDLTKGLNAVETAPPANYMAAHYMETFTFDIATTTAQCAHWEVFRASLKPDNYTCVQLLGSNGPGVTSCDPTKVSAIATALRDGAIISETIDGNVWNTSPLSGPAFGFSIEVGDGDVGCLASHALRPCITGSNWGGVAGTDANSTCSEPTQSIFLNFR